MRLLRRLIQFFVFVVVALGIWLQVSYERGISNMRKVCASFHDRERHYHTPVLVYEIMCLLKPEEQKKDNMLSNALFTDCTYVEVPEDSRAYITHVYLTEAEKDALIAAHESENRNKYDPSVEKQ